MNCCSTFKVSGQRFIKTFIWFFILKNIHKFVFYTFSSFVKLNFLTFHFLNERI